MVAGGPNGGPQTILALKMLNKCTVSIGNSGVCGPRKQIFEIYMALCGPQAKIIENPWTLASNIIQWEAKCVLYFLNQHFIYNEYRTWMVQ